MYTVFRKDRGDGYGGVAIFVKTSLKIVNVDLDPVFLSLECIVLDLLIKGYPCIRCICIYNPPSLANNVDHTDCICSFLDTYAKGCVFCVGDFNYPHINWKIPISHGSIAQNKFLTCTLQNGLTQVVHHPTHGSNCIDLVLVSNPCIINNLTVVKPFFSTCDHSSVNFSILCPGIHKSNPSRCLRDFRRADYSALISLLLDVDWLLLYNTSLNADEFWTKISQVLDYSISLFVPLSIVHSRKSFIPKHICSLLLKKKYWYPRNKLIYRRFVKQYDDAVKS